MGNIPFYFTSAKNGMNVDKLFADMAAQLLAEALEAKSSRKKLPPPRKVCSGPPAF